MLVVVYPECMLGKGVILVEGSTEYHALPVLARALRVRMRV